MFDTLNSLYDAVMAPMATWPGAASCAVISVLMAVLLLFAFKYVSPQSKIAQVKDKMTASVLSVWLYRDHPRMIVRGMGNNLAFAGQYLGLSLIPLAVFIGPMVLVFAQMGAYYEYKPIEPGATTVVTATLSDAVKNEATVSLDAPDSIEVQTAHFDPAARQYAWNLKCNEPGAQVLKVKVDGATYEKSLVVGSPPARIQAERVRTGSFVRVLFPSEPMLPADGALDSIYVTYSGMSMETPDWLDWMFANYWIIWSFLIIMIAVLVFRKPMGVAI
jgi:hypothetical protein